MTRELSKESLSYPQIDAAFLYIYDNPDKYQYRKRFEQPLTDVYEFGVYNGRSLVKICDYAKQYEKLTGVTISVKGYDAFEGLPAEYSGVKKFSKFVEGAYTAKRSAQNIEDFIKYNIGYQRINIYKSWFNNIDETVPDAQHDYKPALLIHIDCDLYISTKQALEYMLEHDLIKNNTIIAYDEFESTNNPKSGGESRAHREIFNCRNGIFKTDEVWHNIYYDKDTGQRIRQSVWEIFDHES